MLLIESLNFRYDHASNWDGGLLFRDLTYQLQPGRVLRINGDNGAGKSTLLKILAGILAPVSGEVSFNGLLAGSPPYLRGLSYLPAEGNGFFDQLDLWQNLKFWWQLRHREPFDRDRTNQLLREWRLDGSRLMQHFPVEKFSTGMKRRLAMIRLQQSRALLWLLDEPLLGLDQQGISQFQAVLHHHLNVDQGLAVVVSHDQAAWRSFDSVCQTLTLGRELMS